MGLSGCRKAKKPAKHELSQITAVSISSGNMDRSCGYSFWARREETGWFLNAECFPHRYERETVFENRAIDRENAKMLLEILERSGSVAYVENYRKPKKFAFHVADEETYCFCLTFADGSQYVTRDRQTDLERFFYRLAEKYHV